MDDFTAEDVSEFQRHWQEAFHETISPEFAKKRLGEVIALFTFLAEWSMGEAPEVPTLSDEVPPLLPQVE